MINWTTDDSGQVEDHEGSSSSSQLVAGLYAKLSQANLELKANYRIRFSVRPITARGRRLFSRLTGKDWKHCHWLNWDREAEWTGSNNSSVLECFIRGLGSGRVPFSSVQLEGRLTSDQFVVVVSN